MLNQVVRSARKTTKRRDDYREKSKKECHQHLRGYAVADPDNYQRGKRDLWKALEQNHNGIKHAIRRRPEKNRDGDEDAANDSREITEDDFSGRG